jgi:hypothetical protein
MISYHVHKSFPQVPIMKGWIRSIPPHTVSLRAISLLSYTHFLCLHSSLFPSGLKAKLRSLSSTSELYRLRDSCLSVKLVPIFLRIEECRIDSATDPYCRILGLSRLQQLLFLPSSSSIVLTRLSGPRSRPTTSQKIWSNLDLWICSQELWTVDHRGGLLLHHIYKVSSYLTGNIIYLR